VSILDSNLVFLVLSNVSLSTVILGAQVLATRCDGWRWISAADSRIPFSQKKSWFPLRPSAPHVAELTH
jgi:hypothetical protein